MERPREKLLVLRSGPGGAAVGLRTAAEMAVQGERVSLCLIQDGVLCALKGNQAGAAGLLAQALEAGVGLRYLEDDLAARGFGSDDLLVGASPLGYGELVELMLADDRQVLGAFYETPATREPGQGSPHKAQRPGRSHSSSALSIRGGAGFGKIKLEQPMSRWKVDT